MFCYPMIPLYQSNGSDGRESTFNAGDGGSVPGLGRSPAEGNGNPLQNSCLENPMDRGAWRATVHGAAKSQTRLSDFTHTHTHTHTYICTNCNVDHKGFPSGSAVKNPPAMQETQVQSLGWEDPLQKEMATHSNILA